MRTLILGATGFLGSRLISLCEERGYHHLGTCKRSTHDDFLSLDLREQNPLQGLVLAQKPDIIFLTAGPNHPTIAERFPQEVWDIAVTGAETVAKAAMQIGSTVVTFVDESLPISPFTKARDEGIKTVKRLVPENHLIIRTSRPFGSDLRGANYVERWRRQLLAGEEVPASVDQAIQPTFGEDLVRSALDLAVDRHCGVVDIVGPDRHTEFTFARLAAHVFGFDVDQIATRSVKTAQRAQFDRIRLRTLLGDQAVRSAADGLRAQRHESLIEESNRSTVEVG